jgi:hypothetical protein
VAAGNFERSAAGADPNSELLLDSPYVGVVLANQAGEVSRVVEMKFERVFGA